MGRNLKSALMQWNKSTAMELGQPIAFWANPRAGVYSANFDKTYPTLLTYSARLSFLVVLCRHSEMAESNRRVSQSTEELKTPRRVCPKHQTWKYSRILRRSLASDSVYLSTPVDLCRLCLDISLPRPRISCPLRTHAPRVRSGHNTSRNTVDVPQAPVIMWWVQWVQKTRCLTNK